MYGYLLTAIPITRVVYTISIVAQLQPHSLPSPVVGPVFPSVLPPVVTVSEDGLRMVGTSYTLTCRVTLPSGVQAVFNLWHKRSASPDPPVIHKERDDSYIATITLNPLQETDAGDYDCTASYAVNIFHSPLVTATINVIVLRPLQPIIPTIVKINSTTSNGAIIQWTVAYISYSPETYIVQYGTSEDSLIQNSSSVYSGNDITITNKTYSVELSGLRDNTTYYVQVQATNTAQRSHTSIVVRLTTLPLTETETVLPTLIVLVRAEGSAVAGSNNYTLVCDITNIEPVSDDMPSITVMWIVPSGISLIEMAVAIGQHNFYSRLPLTPLTHDDGGDYTCDAYYTLDGTRSPTASNTYHVTIINIISVEAEGSGSGVVGSLYTLTCTVTLSDRPASGSSVSIQWQGPAGLSHSNDDDTTDNRVVVSQLALDPLTLAHGGDYTCTAEYTVNGQTATESGNRAVSVKKDESGQAEADSPVGIVAAGITVVILLTAITGLSVFVLLWCKYKRSDRNKYSFTEGNLAISTPGGPVDRDKDSRKAEEIEIASVAPTEERPVETQEDVILEETDDYFQDPTAIMPAIEPVSIERFPDYVRDMLQNKESKLKTEFMTLAKLSQPPSTVAILPHNKDHNRFKNIYPYDKSRVCLTEAPGVKHSDYINASFIDGYGGRKNAYIAAQGPVEASVESDSGGWCGNTSYRLLLCSLSVLKLERSNVFATGLRNYMTVSLWMRSYHGVPENVMSLIAFIRHLRKLHPVSQPQPLLVHCSAGVGRTGTLILLDIVMQQMKAEGCIGVHHWLRMMRMQRMKMVQSQQQYEFIHCGLSEFVVCGETEVAAANLRIATKNLKKTTDHGMTGFQKQLQIIDEVSSHYTVSYADAKQEYNKNKNRFPDKLPNDMYRVRLRRGPQPGSDYINASFISGYKQKHAYIAAQCPLKSTVADFWRMVNEFQCGCVIMLCELEEEGQESSYCFWPKEEGDSEVHGKLTVNLQSVKTLGDIVTRHLNMVEGSAALNQAKRVTMLQLTSWPMKGLPHTSAVLSLIEKLTAAQMKSSNKRIIVMCSDGMSCTGTFLTIHSQIERVKTEGVVDFLQAIKSARLQRAGLVLNADHYTFCHEVLNTFLDNFDTYANFEFKEVI